MATDISSTVAGEKYHRLTAVSFINTNRCRQQRWLFRCDCGSDHIAILPHVKRGGIKSCGCLISMPPLRTSKRCPRCKIEKPFQDFSPTTKGTYAQSYCRECRAGYNSAHSKRHKQELRLSVIRRFETKDDRIKKIFWSSQRSAATRGLTFLIQKSDITQLAEQQEWKCAKTGIAFDMARGNGQRPFGPTIDRIDNGRGYEPNNIQLVCYLYNMAKNRFADADVLVFARALLNHSRDTEISQEAA